MHARHKCLRITHAASLATARQVASRSFTMAGGQKVFRPGPFPKRPRPPPTNIPSVPANFAMPMLRCNCRISDNRRCLSAEAFTAPPCSASLACCAFRVRFSSLGKCLRRSSCHLHGSQALQSKSWRRKTGVFLQIRHADVSSIQQVGGSCTWRPLRSRLLSGACLVLEWPPFRPVSAACLASCLCWPGALPVTPRSSLCRSLLLRRRH